MMLLNLFVYNIVFIYTGILFIEGSTEAGQLSKTKCQEYSRYATESNKCDVDRLGLGTMAEEGTFPHMVILGEKNNENILWLCTGSLISEEFVIVPAHCLINIAATPTFVRLGTSNLAQTEHIQDLQIKEKIVHPQFKIPKVYNDIGLVRLEKKVEFNKFVRPACLYTEKDIPTGLFGSGWGTLGFLGSLDDRLHSARLEVYDLTRCNETISSYSGVRRRLPNGITPETMVCINAKEDLTRSVPLEILDKQYPCMFDIVAIGSFGKLIPNTPDVYIKVAPYISWIEETVWGGP